MKIWMSIACLSVLSASGVHAQTLSVQVVMTKRLGEKTLARLPHTLTCPLVDPPPAAGTRPQALGNLRIGVEVPIPVTKDDGKTSFQYRNVGTDIECWGEAQPEGRFKIAVRVQQSSMYTPTPIGDVSVPAFRSWTTMMAPVLRDGQSTQGALGTDATDGEVTTVDVSLKVVK